MSRAFPFSTQLMACGALVALAVLNATPAQAVGFEYDYANFDGGMGTRQSYLSGLKEDVGVRFTSRGHVLTWHDDSGFLTSFLSGGVMSNREERKKEAEKNGNTTYWYEESGFIMGPLNPGKVSSLTFGFGNGVGAELTSNNQIYTSYPDLAAEYKFFSYHADILPFSLREMLGDTSQTLPWLDLVTCLNVEARGQTYHVVGTVDRDGMKQNIDRTLLAAAMPISVATDLQVLPGLHLEGLVGYEVLGGLGKLRDVAGHLFGVTGGEEDPLGNRQPLVYGLELKLGAPRILFAHLSYRAIHSALGPQPFDDQTLMGGGGVFF
jgi:hypothetical protein